MLNVINQKSSLNAFVGFFSQTVSSARLLYFLSGDQRWGYRHQIVVSPPSSWRRRTLLTKKKENPHFGMFSFPPQIGKYGDAPRWKPFWLLAGWQIRGRLHFDIYNVFLPQFSVGSSPSLPPPSGWLRRPPWGPDTAAPIFQAVISPSFPVLKTP